MGLQILSRNERKEAGSIGRSTYTCGQLTQEMDQCVRSFFAERPCNRDALACASGWPKQAATIFLGQTDALRSQAKPS